MTATATENKNPIEEKDFNAFICSQNGILKGVLVNKKGIISKNFDSLDKLSKVNGYTCLGLGDKPNEILVGNRVPEIKSFNIKDKTFSNILKIEEDLGKSTLVGVTSYEGNLVTAAQNGQIIMSGPDAATVDAIEIAWNNRPTKIKNKNLTKAQKQELEEKKKKLTEEEEKELQQKKLEKYRIGKKLTRLRRCPASMGPTEPLIAVAGQEVELQVWNLKDLQKPVFRARNVTHDKLDLRVPVWTSDIAWLSPTLIAVCSRHGQIRKYDISGGKRRPVSSLLWLHQDEPATCTAIVAVNEHEVLVGSATGALVLCDFRKAKYTKRGYPRPLCGILRKFRGSVGAIKEISYSNGYIGAVGLDRFLRVYKFDRKVGLDKNLPLYQVYLKSKLMGIHLMPGFDPEYEEPVEEKKKETAVVQVIDTKDQEEEDSIEVIIANTRLEQLLSLPKSKYKQKKHPFYKFFLKTEDLRKTLKITDSEDEREKAMDMIREKFVAFKNAAAIRALCDGEVEQDLEDMVPRKKRKYD